MFDGTKDVADMAAKNDGSLLTSHDRNTNIVRCDSFRYIALDRTSNDAVMISSIKAS